MIGILQDMPIRSSFPGMIFYEGPNALMAQFPWLREALLLAILAAVIAFVVISLRRR